MRYTSVLCGFMALATFTTAIPISSGTSPKFGEDAAIYGYTRAVPDTMDKKEDGDDKVFYTWAVPQENKEKREDGDDKVVYTWAVPQESKEKREDGDDKVVYTWAVPYAAN